jgi:hypothetical protein
VAAQQGRYRTASGDVAVGLQMRFHDASAAAALLTAMGQDAAGCQGPPPAEGGGYERRYTAVVHTGDALDLSFQEFGGVSGAAGWHVLGAREASWVGLFYVEQRSGVPLPDPRVLLPAR